MDPIWNHFGTIVSAVRLSVKFLPLDSTERALLFGQDSCEFHENNGVCCTLMMRGTTGGGKVEGATGYTVTPSWHNEQESDVNYFAFCSSSLSGTAPLLLTVFLTMMSTGVASLP